MYECSIEEEGGVEAQAPPATGGRWIAVCRAEDVPADGGACVLVGNRQIAIFHYARREQWFATDNRCPHWGEMVLARGLLGDQDGEPKVACPMHKRTFALIDGRCLSGDVTGIRTYPIEVGDGIVRIAVDLDCEP